MGTRPFKGVGGGASSDLRAVEEALERASQLAIEPTELAELDLNPMIVQAAGKGVVAVDARVVLAPSSRSGPSA